LAPIVREPLKIIKEETATNYIALSAGSPGGISYNINIVY